MGRFEQVNILDVLDDAGESDCQEILRTFVCPKNKDVERFLHCQAIDFAKKRLAITYLLVGWGDDDKKYLLGYYALANKFVRVYRDKISRSFERKIQKFSPFDESEQCYLTAMPLIAQLGKNFNPDLPLMISGSQLLETAMEQVKSIERLIGGKTVYIECANEPHLFDFYSQASFVTFGQRPSTVNHDETLVQMIKYF